MIYFCKALLTAKQNQEQTLYLILDAPENEYELPQLTKEQLVNHHGYKAFVTNYRPKGTVAVDYAVYRTDRTDREVNASTPDEDFEKLIADKTAERLSGGEIMIEHDEKPDKITGKVQKKKKTSKVVIFAAVMGCLLAAVGALAAGIKLGELKAAVPEEEAANTAEDGLIIPVQADIAADAEQITVTIDRSYSAVPLDDLQLKGAVSGGKANITLPEFDKGDFFTHVAGYTWGFSSDPEGEKIEYYGGKSYDFTKDTKLYRVLVKYGGGSGTKDDPYQIDYYDQLELMGQEKARGYFIQTADISFPSWASHSPINTVNELKADPKSEYFEYDGGGYLIENLDAPLFGSVSGAVIRNVNIKNSRIETQEYQDYGFIVCNAYNYHYRTEGTDDKESTVYVTGETLIQHCTVSHSSINVQYPPTEEDNSVQTAAVVTAPPVTPPDLIEYDEEGNPITTTEPVITEPTKHAEHCIGAISGNGGEISGCYVTDFGIYAYLDEYYLYAGGISGKPASVTDSCVNYFSAQGNIFDAGGIVGTAAGTRAYDAKGREMPDCYGGSIQGCNARNIILSTEMTAGGIAGEGSTDAEGAVISNCYANELTFSCGTFEDTERQIPIKAGTLGGIIAADGTGKKGHLITNSVSHADFPVIGKAAKSRFDDTVRQAPSYAFYQENILTVINRNTVDPVNPKEIYTGSFMFGEQGEFGDETGNLAYPEAICDLFEKTIVTQGG